MALAQATEIKWVILSYLVINLNIFLFLCFPNCMLYLVSDCLCYPLYVVDLFVMSILCSLFADAVFVCISAAHVVSCEKRSCFFGDVNHLVTQGLYQVMACNKHAMALI